MFIQRIEDFQIPKEIDIQIGELLEEAFPGYPKGQSYYKQVPDFRYLVWNEEELIGHMAIEHRLMSNGGNPIKVFGVTDLCVKDSFQHKKLATRLLQELEDLGRKFELDFIILLARDHELYLTNGFQLVKNDCRWLLIHDNASLGIIHRKIEQTLMMKPLSSKKWKNGLLDFLGPAF